MMLGDRPHTTKTKTFKQINKYENTRVFLVESRHTTFYNHTLRVNINIQRKNKKLSTKLPNSTTFYLKHTKIRQIKVRYLVYLQEYLF